MNAQYKTFEEAEKALSNNKHLKNNEIIETETNYGANVKAIKLKFKK